MKFKLGLIAASIVLCIGMFTACGSGINDAQSLNEASKTAQEAVKNFHMDSTVEMKVGYDLGDGSASSSGAFEMPMKMKTTLDSSKETAHGRTDVEMTFMGQGASQGAEVYCDMTNNCVYTKADGTTQWIASNQDADMAKIATSASEMSDAVLKKAEFKEEDDEYVLTVAAKDMGDVINETGLAGSMGSGGVNFSDLAIDGGTITYKYFKDSQLLKSMEMDDVSLKATAAVQGQNVKMNVKMDADYKFSKYDEVDASAYEIPDEVKAQKTGTATQQATTQAATTQEATTQATGDPLPKAETQIILDGATTPDDQGWYVVGQDSIPAGTYKVFHGEGQGILTIQGTMDTTWTIGYSHKDELKDGTKVVLNNGDNVFITKELALVFDPVN